MSKEEHERLETEVRIAAGGNAFEMGILKYGKLTPFTCPECHGVLVEIKEDRSVRYRCHTGHGFTPDALAASIKDSTEETLWTAIRAMEESAMLLGEMANRVRGEGKPAMAEALAAEARFASSRAASLQKLAVRQAGQALPGS